ncbi:hypothetical protein [Allosphingosinicella vermicomposti]|uniref:hypothetical protein n=1 Tax=Allosphingosinicella vermicomposti TaxID=614671 RepID=UPI000D0E9641|nr:hypothetical protein [Allosphingosinicella vermicomposti]
MDAMLTFEEEWLPVDETEGGSGIESLLGAGMDERRLHLRAHRRWMTAHQGCSYPTMDDLVQAGTGEFTAFDLLLDFNASDDVPMVRHVGHRLRATLGSPAGGPLLARLTAYYPMIAESGAPVGFEAELSNGRGGSTLYRGILMPVAGRADGGPALYGVITSRELADSQATLSLAFEVDRALHEGSRFSAEQLWNSGSATDDPARMRHALSLA